MNSEQQPHFINEPQKGNEDMSKKVQEELNNISHDLDALHGDGINGLRADAKGNQFVEIIWVTKRHPQFGRFLENADEVLHLDANAQQRLESIETCFLRGQIEEDERDELFKRYLAYISEENKFTEKSDPETLH